MKDFISDKVKDLKPSGIRKFFDLASEVTGCISLGVGEPDFDTPWHISKEGITALEQGKTFYTSNAGLKDLRISIGEYLSRKFNLNYDPINEIIVTVGGSEAIDLTFRTIIEPGDEVIIPEPSFVSYVPCAILAGAKPVTVTLKDTNNFKLTKDDLLKAITPKTKILVFPFPNNPTGSVMDYKDLEEIAKVCIEKDIFVLSDEIYSELTYDNKHISIASLPSMKERCVVINGFSKSYAMTGWRLGYCAGPKNVMSQILKIHQFAIMCAPTNSQFAAIEALKNGDSDIEHMKEAYDMRRRFLVHRLREMGFDCFLPEGAFYVFPSIKNFKMTSEEFCTKLLQEEKVVVVPGNAFGESGEGYVRISYAYSLEDLSKALSHVERFAKKYLNKD